MSDVALQHEAHVVARCLIGRDPTEAECARYAAAVTRRAAPLAGREARLWARVLAHPRLFNAVDAALALLRPASGIRQRGYTMLAVLEASTEHTDLFLARRRPLALVTLTVVSTAIAGALRVPLGLLVVAATR